MLIGMKPQLTQHSLCIVKERGNGILPVCALLLPIPRGTFRGICVKRQCLKNGCGIFRELKVKRIGRRGSAVCYQHFLSIN